MGKNVQRQAVLDALIAGASIKQAATAGQVSGKTVYRWLDEPEFSAQLTEAQRAVTKRVTWAAISRAERAACVLDEVMCNEEAAPGARVSAARALLDYAFKAIETEEIITRLEALEALQSGE